MSHREIKDIYEKCRMYKSSTLINLAKMISCCMSKNNDVSMEESLPGTQEAYLLSAKTNLEIYSAPKITIVGKAIIDMGNENKEMSYFSNQEHERDVNLFFKKETTVVFVGQKNPNAPYIIQKNGWFTPRKEDILIFQGQTVYGKIL